LKAYINLHRGHTQPPHTTSLSLVKGGLEYLHCSPASRRKEPKGNQMPEGLTGHPVTGDISTDIWTSRLGVHARLTTVFCKKNIYIVAKFKEVKTGCCNLRNRQIWQNLQREGMAQTGLLWRRRRRLSVICFPHPLASKVVKHTWRLFRSLSDV
jgi:hypothetical protein